MTPTSRRFLIGTSWKMNKTLAEAGAYVDGVRSWVGSGVDGLELFVLPPYTALSTVHGWLAGSPVRVGAQDVSAEADGAHTGDISARMLVDAGAVLVEVGHQERRRDHGETDRLVNAKVHRCLRAGLRPLVCVGESADDLRFGVHAEALSRQVKMALHGVPAEGADQVLVAYEPGWAIGEGAVAADTRHIAEAHLVIRDVLGRFFGEDAAAVPLLYGGSITASNAVAIAGTAQVDGLFVGRAGLKDQGMLTICDAVQRALAQPQRKASA